MTGLVLLAIAAWLAGLSVLVMALWVRRKDVTSAHPLPTEADIESFMDDELAQWVRERYPDVTTD